MYNNVGLYNQGKMTDQDFAKVMDVCLGHLSESVECLRLQSPGTFDYHVLASSKALIKDLQRFKSVLV